MIAVDADGRQSLAAKWDTAARIGGVGLRGRGGQTGNARDEIWPDVGVVCGVRIQITFKRLGIFEAHAGGA